MKLSSHIRKQKNPTIQIGSVVQCSKSRPQQLSQIHLHMSIGLNNVKKSSQTSRCLSFVLLFLNAAAVAAAAVVTSRANDFLRTFAFFKN